MHTIKYLCFISFRIFVFGILITESKSKKFVQPEYLDMLLQKGLYKEFSQLVGIPSVDLVRPSERRETKSGDPLFNDGLYLGDTILPEDSEGRQGLNFQRCPGVKWPGYIPYTISEEFDENESLIIEDTINKWNGYFNNCITWIPKYRHINYVHFFPGNGCYSTIGRARGQQVISLDRSYCLKEGIILHEMEHTIGFAHEHNRNDRDDYIKIEYKEIPEEYWPHYEKVTPPTFELQGSYDYYSIMHSPVKAPGSNKDAFKIRQKGIDKKYIGQRDGFTEMDIQKILELYECQ